MDDNNLTGNFAYPQDNSSQVNPVNPTQSAPTTSPISQPPASQSPVSTVVTASESPDSTNVANEQSSDTLDTLLGKLKQFKEEMNNDPGTVSGISAANNNEADQSVVAKEAVVDHKIEENVEQVKEIAKKDIFPEPSVVDAYKPEPELVEKDYVSPAPVMPAPMPVVPDEDLLEKPDIPPDNSIDQLQDNYGIDTDKLNPVNEVLDSVNDLPKADTVTPFEQKVDQVVSSVQARRYTIFELLQMVIDRNSSDLHIKVGYPAQLRIDGDLVPVNGDIVDENYAQELIFSLLDDAKRDKLEVNRELDFAYSYEDKGRFRINAFYQRKTPSMALRLIPSRIKNMQELGLPTVYNSLTKLNQGFILVTGPTGSGKSTTLAAMIQDINLRRACHILTIEDPIEYVYPSGKAMVSQREVGDDTHGWEIAMKSALREDPDVILVGEMRDYETIASAITLAETGHLVFATLHTNSAAQTVERIIDVFPAEQQNQVRSQLAGILEAVIAQRLVPITGGGRKAVSEIMLANPAIRNLIREGKTHQIDNVIRTSADIGMISIEHSLVQMVREGTITMETAQKYAVKPEEIIRLMKE